MAKVKMSERDGIHELPDGSAFFMGIVRDKPMAYPIVLLRNTRSAHQYCTVDGSRQWGWLKCFRWAFHVTPIYFGGYWK